MKISLAAPVEDVQIGAAAPAERAAALELALGALPKAEREGLVRQALAGTGEQAASAAIQNVKRSIAKNDVM